MKLSNTKLNAFEKLEYKRLKAWAKDAGIVVRYANGFAIAYKAYENNVRFATSIASASEIKARAKVGKYLALYRFECGEIAVMPNEGYLFDDFLSLCGFL